MHELGIASSILDAVRKERQRYPDARICRVGVRIGEYAGVDAESLSFCFDALVKDSDLEPLELAIESCRAGQGARGDELDLQYLELEDTA